MIKPCISDKLTGLFNFEAIILVSSVIFFNQCANHGYADEDPDRKGNENSSDFSREDILNIERKINALHRNTFLKTD
jgi:hypothetical protein